MPLPGLERSTSRWEPRLSCPGGRICPPMIQMCHAPRRHPRVAGMKRATKDTKWPLFLRFSKCMPLLLSRCHSLQWTMRTASKPRFSQTENLCALWIRRQDFNPVHEWETKNGQTMIDSLFQIPRTRDLSRNLSI